jgi:hypothetical protein
MFQLLLSKFNVASYQFPLTVTPPPYMKFVYVMLHCVKIIIKQDCYKNLLRPKGEGEVNPTTGHEGPKEE